MHRAAPCRNVPVTFTLDGDIVAFTEFEKKRCEKLVGAFLDRRRPPPHLRDQVDLVSRIKGQSVELLEVRAAWDGGERKTERPLARATYNQGTRTWAVYWQRSDLKWHRYHPAPEVGSIEEFLTLVEEDAHACFFG